MKRIRDYMGSHSSHKVFDQISIPPSLPKKIKLCNKTLQSNNTTNEIMTQTQCGICLHAFVRPITLLKCKHSFCYSCAFKWFEINENCPLCKSNDIRYLQYRYLRKYAVQHKISSQLSSKNSNKESEIDQNILYECDYEYIYLWDISKRDICSIDNISSPINMTQNENLLLKDAIYCHKLNFPRP